MDDKRILMVQDISCLGQCSLTVALPIISACGVEACVLPSALLSTHTGGFTGYTCLDLTDEMRKIIAHFKSIGAKFDAVYTGYLADSKQMDVVRSILREGLSDFLIVDPVMGDNGKLYPAFDMNFVDEMRSLCREADIILPNITEASLLTGAEYRERYDEQYVRELMDGVLKLGVKTVVMTGVSYDESSTGIAVLSEEGYFYYPHKRIARSSHGTGDVYASTFTGALMRGKSVNEAAVIAADYTLDCIESTVDDPSHWYGVKFEKCLGKLVDKLK
ncbi:MAG: pyridoxamine kinase [Clostridia bacterium]|nr:pyridoxamine kinase [Clostridia bacterium]